MSQPRWVIWGDTVKILLALLLSWGGMVHADVSVLIYGASEDGKCDEKRREAGRVRRGEGRVGMA